MSNGEHLYTAIAASVMSAVRDKLKDLDWDDLCGDAYKGFRKDVADDLDVDLDLQDDVEEPELVFTAYLNDGIDGSVLKRTRPLSDMLIELIAENGDDPGTIEAFNTSIRRLQAHLQEPEA
jgi:hypothetical protein